MLLGRFVRKRVATIAHHLMTNFAISAKFGCLLVFTAFARGRLDGRRLADQRSWHSCRIDVRQRREQLCERRGAKLFTPKARNTSHTFTPPAAVRAAGVFCFMLHRTTPAKHAHAVKNEREPGRVTAHRLKLLPAGLARWLHLYF